MSLTVEPQPIPLTTTPDGAVRVSGTRVPLETVVRAFHQGATPEEIVQDFSTLTLPPSTRCWPTTSPTARRWMRMWPSAPRAARHPAPRMRWALTQRVSAPACSRARRQLYLPLR